MRINKLIFLTILVFAISCESDMNTASEQTGQGGSMTRFAINNGFLYIADHSSIQVFDIQAGTFQKVGDVEVTFGLETIFARGEYLYLGSRDAMYIYSIEEPQSPSFIFRYSHIVSCDPVVVQGNRAYVTLRAGSFCNRGANALEIIDISNPNNPSLIANYPMNSPHGLGVDGNLLFICEGDQGLKVFNIGTETSIELVTHLTTLHAYDVIPRDGILHVTGEDGIFQYRYTPDGTLELLSKIPVDRAEV